VLTTSKLKLKWDGDIPEGQREDRKAVQQKCDTPDIPYSSFLVLGWIDNRPIHVVIAINANEQKTIVITAYEPNLHEWKPGFQKRR